jgi:hypothetical protein
MKLRIEIPVILHTLGKFYSDPIPEKTWRKKKGINITQRENITD